MIGGLEPFFKGSTTPHDWTYRSGGDRRRAPGARYLRRLRPGEPNAATRRRHGRADQDLREVFASAHGLPRERCFQDWRDLLGPPALARVAIVATPDHVHTGPALAAIEHGYDVLLEKPIAPRAVDCLRVVEAADAADRLLQFGHCLRYTSFYAKVHEIMTSGRLGRLITLSMAEHVGFWHMTHAFVRGKWGNTKNAAPMILAKCCHDLDLMAWFVERPCLRVASFGSLRHFRPEDAPLGAPERCTDGCPVKETCVHYAPRFYLKEFPGWPWSTSRWPLT